MQFIKMNEINKYYGTEDCKQQVLNNICLELSEGDMISIMGPSGSGKSTLLNILGLLDKPSEGIYMMEGKAVSAMNDKELAKIRNEYIGFVFQGFQLMKELTALENVEMSLKLSNIHRRMGKKLGNKVIRRKSIKMLEDMGLKNHLYKKPSQLSGGQQQRVAIARALINEPKLILADEPTGALDQQTGEVIMNILTDLHKKGKTIVVVTHDQHVADYCDKHIYMRDGVLNC